MNEQYKRSIRSFVLRQGRLTKGQEFALEHFWPVYGIDKGTDKFDFSTLFAREAPLALEIGFGNGESLAEMAEAQPDYNFIGIEVHRPGVGRLLHLIDEKQLNNLKVINDDAVEILKIRIPKHSIDRVQLYFPDPWHKKKHHKRRIVQAEFVQLIHSLLKPGGIFHMATDWQDYAEHMAETMSATDNFTSLSDSPFSPKPAFRPSTKFEQRGIKLGHGVWDLLYRAS